MKLEFHQLDRRHEHLRVRNAQRERQLLASLATAGQQSPIIVVAVSDQPEHGYVHQKKRKQSDKWIPTERAYGRYRVDVPGRPGQREVRFALGFCRDRISAMLKLQNAMSDAGVLDAAKLRERISSTATFAQQAQWMIAEMKAGRTVNGKTRERIGDHTIDFYSTAIAYLNEVLGEKQLAGIDNAQARELVTRMRNEDKDGSKRFSVKTLNEYFKTFTKVVRSAVDDNGNQVHPRNWNLVFIGLPTENGTMLSPENFFRDGFESVLKKMGRTGVRFHAFRRFREAVLQKSEARQLHIDYWMGHENDDMSTRYGKQLLEDVSYRKEWAEKIALGFDLPTSEPVLIGLRGLQNEERVVAV